MGTFFPTRKKGPQRPISSSPPKLSSDGDIFSTQKKIPNVQIPHNYTTMASTVTLPNRTRTNERFPSLCSEQWPPCSTLQQTVSSKLIFIKKLCYEKYTQNRNENSTWHGTIQSSVVLISSSSLLPLLPLSPSPVSRSSSVISGCSGLITTKSEPLLFRITIFLMSTS